MFMVDGLVKMDKKRRPFDDDDDDDDDELNMPRQLFRGTKVTYFSLDESHNTTITLFNPKKKGTYLKNTSTVSIILEILRKYLF